MWLFLASLILSHLVGAFLCKTKLVFAYLCQNWLALSFSRLSQFSLSWLVLVYLCMSWLVFLLACLGLLACIGLSGIFFWHFVSIFWLVLSCIVLAFIGFSCLYFALLSNLVFWVWQWNFVFAKNQHNRIKPWKFLSLTQQIITRVL